jgi:hypothetical protein
VERQRRRRVQKRISIRKTSLPGQLDETVERLIRDQQQLLYSMINKDEILNHGGTAKEN